MNARKKNQKDFGIGFDDIGDRIKLAIKCRNISQKTLCKLVEISENSLVNYIKGKSDPLVKILIRICDICQVSIGWVISGEVNISLCGVLTQSFYNKKISPELIIKKMEITDKFIENMAALQLEPSLAFVKKYYDLFHDELDKDLLLTIIGSKTVEAMDFKNDISNVFDPNLLEIISLIHDDYEAQDLILEILHTRNKQKKLKKKLISGT